MAGTLEQELPKRLEHELPKTLDAPAQAREAVHRLDGRVAPDLIEDASLLVSELVTNSVKYGGDGRIQLEIEAERDRLRAEIVDQGDGFDPHPRAMRDLKLEDEGGWGLHLVERLADDWGVHAGSTHVWFELRR